MFAHLRNSASVGQSDATGSDVRHLPVDIKSALMSGLALGINSVIHPLRTRTHAGHHSYSDV